MFDGYPDYPTTKGLEHMRRSKRTSRELKFTLNIQCTTNRSKFFQNLDPKHKSRFIEHLVQKLHEETISTFVAEQDAYIEIVAKSVEVSYTHGDWSVVVVG